jgi:hypothetical protein
MGDLVIPEEELLSFTPKEFTEFSIRHKGAPIDLDRRPWLDPIYNMAVTEQLDGNFRRKMLLIFGRQCEKSTSIGNLLIALSNLIPYLRALYVTASMEQMREFSDERLKMPIEDSPVLMRLAGIDKSGVVERQVQNVQTKRWTSRSKIVLRSVYKSPDRTRGISSDLLGIDEIQDIIIDFLPVIEEVLFHSEIDGGPISIYSGTPKTFDNALEFYWGRHSTQNEWLVKCPACNHWNLIDEDHIGPVGLICQGKRRGQGTCAQPINPVDGTAEWVTTGRTDQEWEGFRVPQPVVIYANAHHRQVFDRQWVGLLAKQKRYSRGKFKNEVMARSHDSGTKPVTFEEIRRCCLPDVHFIRDEDDVPPNWKSGQTFAGIDWGSGDGSYTILTIWGYNANGAFQCLYAKKYEGFEADPEYVLEHIVRTLRKWRVNLIGCDWGFGFGLNSKLQKIFGIEKVRLYFHTYQKKKVDYDKGGVKFTTHRTLVMQDFFDLIKKGPTSQGIVFPCWNEFEEFSLDIQSVFSEYNERSRMIIFSHPQGVPDDFVHSGVYALLVSQFLIPRPDLNAPGVGKKRR